MVGTNKNQFRSQTRALRLVVAVSGSSVSAGRRSPATPCSTHPGVTQTRRRHRRDVWTADRTLSPLPTPPHSRPRARVSRLGHASAPPVVPDTPPGTSRPPHWASLPCASRSSFLLTARPPPQIASTHTAPSGQAIESARPAGGGAAGRWRGLCSRAGGAPVAAALSNYSRRAAVGRSVWSRLAPPEHWRSIVTASGRPVSRADGLSPSDAGETPRCLRQVPRGVAR